MRTTILMIMLAVLMTACEYDIIDSKQGEPIAPVSNLDYSVSGSEVTLNWNLPSVYPDDIMQPVSVMIKVTRDGSTYGTYTLDNAPESYVYTSYDSSRTFRFTVKVMGYVDTDDSNVSDLRYSAGVTVEL